MGLSDTLSPARALSLLRSARAHVTLEPAYLAYTVVIGLHTLAISEMYIQKVCRVNLGLAEEVCDHIQLHGEEQVGIGFFLEDENSRWCSATLICIPNHLWWHAK